MTAPARTTARRRGRAGLFVVMSMGMAVGMVMTAMLVMDMAGVVIMLVMTFMIMACMIVGLTMRRVVVRLTVRRVRVASFGIGAAFGIEWRFDLDHAGAQSLHHRLDDVIAPDPQAARGDLCRQMAVAEMPGDPNQMLRISAADLDQRLCRRDDLNQPVIVEHQRIAAPQHGGMFQIEQEFEPACAGHRHSPAMTIIEIEHNCIGRRLTPAMRAMNLRGADHMAGFPINGHRPLPA
jgi:hypothetical protein